MRLASRLLTLFVGISLTLSAWAIDSNIGETNEIKFIAATSTDLAYPLASKVSELSSPVAVYEYVRNNTDFALYHGARSGAVNTFLGGRGNDVDQAAALISMLRAKGYPARYAVGTVRIPSAQVMNWLGVENVDLAYGLLRDQGIQGVVLSTDKSTIDMEHAWVETLVPYGNYRGAGPSAINCVTTPASCNWVSLDPSFKQHQSRVSGLDPYSALSFDYTSYYNALKNNDATRRDKNPLEIYENQILTWLQTNAPGKTLEDIPDFLDILPEQDGLLPASLPFATIGTVRRYNSAADHDAAVPGTEPKKWTKQVSVKVNLKISTSGGGTIQISAGGGVATLPDVATQRLTLTSEIVGGIPNMVARLGGNEIARPISGNGSLGGYVPTVGDPFTISVSMDGAPAPDSSSTDQIITATYNAIVGGYYLVATGGETSNWSQVHRASQQLLDANLQFSIVFNPSEASCDIETGVNCTPYVDGSGNGWDATDLKLLENKPALDALTGGLLYVAGTQYYAKLRDGLGRLDALNKIKTPITGFLGVVSSTYEVEYIDGTAFSVLPGGLLIDMKGIKLAGSWRIDQPASYSNKQFELAGHITSSLEHEVWQELTGYDAISTVRGIQMALANGATLVNPKKNSSTDTMPAAYTAFGFSNGAAPAGFTYKPFSLLGTQPVTWTNTTNGAAFDIIQTQISTGTSALRKSRANYVYLTSNGLYGWVNCVNNQVVQLQGFINQGYGNSHFTSAYSLCDGTSYATSYTVSQIYAALQSNYTNSVIPNYIGQSYFNYFDIAQGFSQTSYVYRATPIAADAQFTSLVQNIRDNLYLQTLTQNWVEYLLPSKQSVGSNFKFAVDIRKAYETATGNYVSATYEILNNTGIAAGGGYVSGSSVLKQATSIAVTGASTVSPTPTFNNATLTDQNTIAEVNNDPIKTPSSADPVSTVTGNNYHDETDFTIKGRNGLNYVFTRTYNSAPSTTKADLGLGFGWVHSYGMRLKSNDYGSCPNCTSTQAAENGNSKTSSITYTDERGGDHNYLVNESTFAVTPPAGEFDNMAFDTPVAGQHTLTFRNGTKYVFETVGAGSLKATPNLTAHLKQIADPWGNQLNFGYNANGRLATVTDNLGISGRTGLVFAYDATNHLQQVSDWSGRSWGYAVDANSNLATYTNALSQGHTYAYTPGTHNLITVAQPLARNSTPVQTTFAYYQNGRTFSDANALGDTETLDYDLYRKTTRITDPRGGIREYEYDSSGRLLKLTEPDGAILQFSNNPDGLRNTKNDGLGYKTQYSYRTDKTIGTASDTYGNVTREQDALSQTVDTTYGIYDQVASIKDKRGTVLTTGFHATTDGTCKAIGKPDTVTLSTLAGVANVKLRSYCWNSDGSASNVTEYLDSAAATYRRTSTAYDSAAHLNVQQVTVSGSDGLSVSRTYTYDNLGRKISETLNRRISPTNAATTALTTSYEYDALDRVTAVIDVYGNRMETVYDANGQVYQQIARYKKADGSFDTRILSTRTYDAADRLLTDTDTLGGVTRYDYDEAGNVISITDPENHTTRYEYDAMNRRTAVIDGNGHRVSTEYDLAGHPVAVTNGNNETTRTVYDNIGRPVQVTDPLGNITQTQYDANNNVICMVDANAVAGLQPKNIDGCTVSTIYDELNRPAQSKDAQNRITKTAYDLLGNVTAITDPKNRTTAYTYDTLGRLIQTTDPLGKATTYARDEAGNAWQITNRLNEITQVSYDVLNRPTRYDYLVDNSYQTTTYSIYGNIMAQANFSISYSYTHDALNRLKTKTDSHGIYLKSLAFNYDKTGRILSKSTYQNTITSYTYDGTGRLAAITNPDYLTVNYQFDGAGRLLSRIMSSGAKSLYQYDANGQLLHLTHTAANGTTLTDIAYTRDRVGNILTQTDSTGTTTFTYDPLYRLTSADYPGTANDETWTYDEVGNRLTHTKGGTARYYNYLANSNRLSDIRLGSPTGAIESAFTFDDEGRLSGQTGVNARIPHWDAKGRLNALTAGGRTDVYLYDPTDHRVGRTGPLYYYLEGEHLESVGDRGKILEKYFRGASIDELVAGYLPDGASNLAPVLYQHDGTMSVVAISNPNGTTIQTSQYSAFGSTINTTGSSVSRLKYTGREDDGTGLYYYRARYYDPTIGRFISEDPLGFQAGINFYAYVNNNPVNANDPTGMAALDFNLGIVGGSIGIDNASGLPFYSFRVGLTGVGATVNPLRNAPSVAGLSTPGQCTYCTVDTVKWQTANIGAGATIGPVSWQPIQYDVPTVVNQYKNGAWVNSGVKSGEGLKVDLTNFSSTFNGGKTGLPLSIDLEANYEQGSTLRWSDVRSFLGLTSLTGSTGGSAAAGGFLLYPNKPNTNQIQSVYSK